MERKWLFSENPVRTRNQEAYWSLAATGESGEHSLLFHEDHTKKLSLIWDYNLNQKNLLKMNDNKAGVYCMGLTVCSWTYRDV